MQDVRGDLSGKKKKKRKKKKRSIKKRQEKEKRLKGVFDSSFGASYCTTTILDIFGV